MRILSSSKEDREFEYAPHPSCIFDVEEDDQSFGLRSEKRKSVDSRGRLVFWIALVYTLVRNLFQIRPKKKLLASRKVTEIFVREIILIFHMFSFNNICL